ncbi:MAG: hypothetical protein HY370_06790 [Proteobacteria bacterium]|nr:hypothetical protein [Pseudomonadota bacterium]
MLSGKKPMAAFGDVWEEGKIFSEEIIPEKAFSPYIANGKILRFKKIIKSSRLGKDVFYVCFTLPGHEWRAEAYFWTRNLTHNKIAPADPSCDIMIGRLLGYSEEDITNFLSS